MTTHAIVVGIDGYDNPAWNLTSAVKDATSFLEWVVEHGGADPEHTILLLSPAPGKTVPPNKAKVKSSPATQQAIQDAVDAIGKMAILPSDRLFVYFACHGIQAPGADPTGGGGPVVIPSDVDDLVRRRIKLYPVEAMIRSLATRGPAEQFFFIDACRDFALDGLMQAPAAASAWRFTDGQMPCSQYALYATSAGGQAIGQYGLGVFTSTLLDALTANGPELGDNGVDYQIKWADVTSFVVDRVKRRVEDAQKKDVVQAPQVFTRIGSGNAVLRSLPVDKIARRTLSVGVQPDSARAECRVVVAQTIPGTEIQKHLSNPALPLPLDVEGLLPGKYVVVVSGLMFVPARMPVTLWGSEAYVEFSMKQVPPDPEGLEAFVLVQREPGRGDLSISSGELADLDIIVRDLADTIVGRGRNNFRVEKLLGGTYKVQVLALDSFLVEELVEVVAERETFWKYRPAPMAVAPSVQGMLGAHGLDQSHDNYVYPSELLGAMPDQTLASLLGLAVASQVFRAGNDLQKLRSFGVRIPESRKPQIVVVVANSDGTTQHNLEVGLMESSGLRSIAPSTLANFPAGAQAWTEASAGVHNVRIKQPDGNIVHYAVAALPERISALVIVTGRSSETQQYMFPNDIYERDADPRHQLEQFVTAERMQRRFAVNQIDAFTDRELRTLLHGKWIDPLFGAIGGYSIARVDDRYASRLHGHVDWSLARDNMVHHFGLLPDSHVLAAITTPANAGAHFYVALQTGVPVVAEGVRALVAWAQANKVAIPPLLAEAYRSLVPGTPWTKWASPRPRIKLKPSGLGVIPLGWEDLADQEDAITALVPRLPTAPLGEAPLPGTRVAVISPGNSWIAPGVVLTVDADGFTHDCNADGEGWVITIESCVVVGLSDAANPTYARR